MNNEEMKKCCCNEEENHSCCEEHGEDHGCCGEHDHECGCGCGEHETLMVDLEDENGNVVKCEVVDGFAYKDNEYAIVQNPEDGSVYLFKVIGDGEEIAELAIPDDKEFDEVKEYYESLLED
ncbi:DUF1292 domain-containing protein [Haloimpatiens massiliensis]|uniref:DUF1292 domain-containing protein n=1 Tax=Haloimpatiens massiliensis TaxID=1658110 RepID=UPI000C84618D|nr:DUF1292 domain-containing protein [Haloimpatiens massiliensis]